MKYIIIFALCFILLTSCADIDPVNSGSVETTEIVTYTNDDIIGDPLMFYGDFVIVHIKEGDYAPFNVVKELGDETYLKVLDLTAGWKRCYFFEEDYFYWAPAYVMYRFDLTTENVSESAITVDILPSEYEITHIYTKDDEYLYLSATKWEEEGRFPENALIYKVARDGSGFEEITRNEIPDIDMFPFVDKSIT